MSNNPRTKSDHGTLLRLAVGAPAGRPWHETADSAEPNPCTTHDLIVEDRFESEGPGAPAAHRVAVHGPFVADRIARMGSQSEAAQTEENVDRT